MSYIIPTNVELRAHKMTEDGVKIQVTPIEIIRRIKEADVALNGTSNDAEHDALFRLREWLSEVYEDLDRRKL